MLEAGFVAGGCGSEGFAGSVKSKIKVMKHQFSTLSLFGSVEWNNIPPVIRHTDSYLAFKSLSKKAMLNPLSLTGDVQ